MLVIIFHIYLYSCMFALVDEVMRGFKTKPKFTKAYVKKVLNNTFFTFFEILFLLSIQLLGKLRNAFKKN